MLVVCHAYVTGVNQGKLAALAATEQVEIAARSFSYNGNLLAGETLKHLSVHTIASRFIPLIFSFLDESVPTYIGMASMAGNP